MWMILPSILKPTNNIDMFEMIHAHAQPTQEHTRALRVTGASIDSVTSKDTGTMMAPPPPPPFPSDLLTSANKSVLSIALGSNNTVTTTDGKRLPLQSILLYGF